MEYYNEKFVNFVKHIESIAEYYPEIFPWLEKIKSADIALFITMAQMSGMFENAIEFQKQGFTTDRNDECEVIIEKFANEYGFDKEKITEVDLMKLCRYCQLFTVMLSEL